MANKKTAAELRKKATELANKAQILLNRAEQAEQMEELDLLRKIKKAGLLEAVKAMIACSDSSSIATVTKTSTDQTLQAEVLTKLMESPLSELT